MINGLGVVGWGVGGIEAEAVMLGQPIYMLMPEVVGFKLTGAPAAGRDGDRPGAHRHADPPQGTAWSTSSSSSSAPACRACRWPTGRRSPTWRRSTAPRWASSRSTPKRCAYLRRTGRTTDEVDLVERYTKEQGLFRTDDDAGRRRSRKTLELDLATVEPCLAGPKRPQDRVPLTAMKQRWRHDLRRSSARRRQPKAPAVAVERRRSPRRARYGDEAAPP